MQRREFINWVGAGFMATSLPIAIAACTPKESPSETTSETEAPAESESSTPKVDDSIREDGFAALGTVAELDANGSLAQKGFIAGPVVVIRDPANPEGIVALNSMCTHQGCGVEWQEGLFACPCHGSKFNPDGTVAEGPAAEPLGSYEAQIDGDLVLIKVQ
ncbi:ubiquinol-cytochrome c reductase iron-sulfur subunit [Romeria aff. gracilis LEGE 07310]|uniref:Ubiquinol-cytochrome c reductase iron-sulfur subunit n=1 Tax=Vasconcelosia minhoensis LEGE 07310 TaxID=915328 RepID=A0A8J7ALT2_9CYAN|nr:ubiquinol-cytochrome c reductase iron-sulfur subunit [Romeria gracilis]MBE9076576.1 ubiquinol-cytochrome c reductase iron-sulfur subunit [Romeria aff. gracilis LEGE 07310]